jgi:hypothetical protein
MRTLPFGTPFTFVEQYEGALVHDVRPAPGHEAERSSRGRVELSIHTDDAFLLADARPEFMALLGVCNPSAVPTQLVQVDDVLELLSPDTIAGLREPSYTFARPASFTINGQVAARPARPILQARADGLDEVSLATQTTVAEAAEPEAARHLEAFRAAVGRAPRRDIVLAPGDVLVFSNARCLHGRPALEAERWLKRLYLRRDRATLDRLAATGTTDRYVARRVADTVG